MTPLSRVTLLVTLVTQVRGLQEWKEQPRSTTALEGQDTVIACKVHNKVGQCFWKKDHRLIYLYPGKYEWAANPSSGDCSLRIKKVSAQFDTGSWSCSVSATTYLGRLYLRDTLESEPVFLTILYPPSHAKIRVANDVSGQLVGVAGRPLDVECLAYGGVPSPQIVWHLAGVLQAEEVTLVDTFTDMESGLDVTRSTRGSRSEGRMTRRWSAASSCTQHWPSRSGSRQFSKLAILLT